MGQAGRTITALSEVNQPSRLLLKGIVSRKFAMLLLIALESKTFSTPFLVNTFLKI
jgi:hypothetical protein